LALDDSDGISLVMLNTSKAEVFFEEIRERLEFAQSNKQKCWQIHLQYASNLPKGYVTFWKEYKNKGSEYILKKYTKGTLSNRTIRFITPVLRKLGLYQLAIKIYSMLGKNKNEK